MKKKIIVTSLLAMACQNIFATPASTFDLINHPKHPKVIADFGGESALLYYKDILIKDKNKPKRKFPPLPEQKQYPIVSQYWHAGHTKAKHHSFPLKQTVFIIGDDKISVDWLKRNATRLAKFQAFGIVVNVKSQQSLDSLRAINKCVALYPNPDPSGVIAKNLGTSTYPILVLANVLGENIDEVRNLQKFNESLNGGSIVSH